MTFLLGKVIEDPEITDPTECLVLLALADATNKETLLCYPSVIRISEVARCDRSTAIRVLKRLERKGWIQIIRRKGPSGVDLANTYRIIKYGELMPAIEPKGEGGTARPSPVAQRDPRVVLTPPGNIKEPKEEKKRGSPILAKPTEAEVISYVTSELRMTEEDGRAIYDSWLANGFRTKSGPLRDFKAAARNWKRSKWFPSQKNPPPSARDTTFNF